jgi:peptidoglycan/LPS O-acetylase OafA/YrhL
MSASDSSPGGTSTRLVALEAARGAAALVVLIHHFELAFAPTLKIALQSTPVGWLQNGAGAVIFFFVLSGYVLTFRSFVQRNGSRLGMDAAKRWPRLWLAPAVSVIAGALVLITGVNANEAAAALSGSQWLQAFGNAHLPAGFHPDLGDALVQSVTLWVGANAGYNSSLWTMQWELLGSFVVFALAALLIGRPLRWAMPIVLVLAAALSVLVSYVVPFIFGCALAYLHARRTRRPTRAMGVALLLIGLLLLCCEDPDRMYLVLAALPEKDQVLAGIYLQSMGAFALIAALRSDLEPLVDGHVARWLGRLSFPIYLVQVIAICTLGSDVFVWTATMPTVVHYGATAVVTLAMTMLLAIPFAYLDEWWRRLVGRVTRRSAVAAS